MGIISVKISEDGRSTSLIEAFGLTLFAYIVSMRVLFEV